MGNPFKAVKRLFSPKVPKLPPPPKVEVPPAPAPQVAAPTQDNSAAEIQAAQEAEKERRATQRGRAATILTRTAGVMGDDMGVATKKLLGR